MSDFNYLNYLEPPSFPKIIVGDRGFLSKYGSLLSSKQILRLMKLAVDDGTLGLAAGDYRTLKLATSIPKSFVIYHVFLPLRHSAINHIATNYLKILYDYLFGWSPSFVANDPLVGNTYQKYSVAQTEYKNIQSSLRFDEEVINSELLLIQKFHPACITLGGDFFDLCIVLKRFDLIEEVINKFKIHCQPYQIKIGFLTYLGALFFDFQTAKNTISNCDVIMLPVNKLGVGMVPSRNDLINWARSLNKPLIGIHILGLNRLELAPALNYAFSEAGVKSVIVGASKVPHIKELIYNSNIIINGPNG